MASVTTITEQLCKTWRMLAGDERDFAEGTSPLLKNAEAMDHYTLPIGSHVVTMHICPGDLRELAAAMFGTDDDAVNDDLAQDVGRELVNCFGSSCANLLRPHAAIEIGMPRRISERELLDVLGAGEVMLEFHASTDRGSPAIRVIRGLH